MHTALTNEKIKAQLSKDNRYRLGKLRLSAAKQSVSEGTAARFRIVFVLYDKKHSGAALLFADAALEGFLYELIQSAVQEHFHLTGTAAKLAMLTKPGRPLLRDYIEHVTGEKKFCISKVLRKIAPELGEALDQAEQMRNRLIHGVHPVNAEQFADGIIGYLLGLDALVNYYREHPIQLASQFGKPVERMGQKPSNLVPRLWYKGLPPKVITFRPNRLHHLIDLRLRMQ